ncbi:MAG TPA: UTP--glucose-1-phosphate uridylyltransferase [Candidatus Saccharimonadales bacterium]|nr:UTP--glucose-1-phosphate uridylyltransferase [Candidatus Saccharimonadales bacterium]
MNTPKVRKAIIAAAGFGTRFLPQTKAMPKEMLPLIDKPIIQYIVEELVDAGIEDIVIVTGYHKRSIEDHFDQMSADLRANLEQAGKLELLEQTKKISDMANFVYIRQKGPYGNATPLLNAEHLIGDEPFIYSFADDFVKASPSRFKQLIAVHQKKGGSVLTCIRTSDPEDFKRYGYIGGGEVEKGLTRLNTIIEKPGSAKEAPSNLASVSGYILEPALFKYLHEAKPLLAGNEEFLLQPSVQKMIEDGHEVYGCEIENGHFYDTGNKLEYLKTVVDFALQHPDVRDGFRDYLKTVLQ